MRWQQTEFVLKGVYIGLLVFVALQEPAPSWAELGIVAAAILCGLVVFLGVAAVRKIREGYRIRGRRLAFVLFLLLENPGLVYAGILSGLLAGIVLTFYYLRVASEVAPQPEGTLLGACAGGGAALGVVFNLLRGMRLRLQRLLVGLAIAGALTGGVITLIRYRPDLLEGEQRLMLGSILLMGIPVFYLLSFASLVEESEVETGTMCAAVGAGLWLIGDYYHSYSVLSLALALPVFLYFYYTWRILPHLRVFKHVFRGMSYASVGRFRDALLSLRRALELNPRNKWAQEVLWDIHRQMDISQIADDPETLALVDFELCLQRVASLLMTPPGQKQIEESLRLLDLVSQHRPEMTPRCEYWRAVAALHAKNVEDAARHLSAAIEGGGEWSNPHRQVVLVAAWQLALSQPQLKARLEALLNQPGRRLDAIAAVERHLVSNPEDTDAWNLKRSLYAELTEAEYDAGLAAGVDPKAIDYGYLRELGMTFLEDSQRRGQAIEYLRIAARGLPQSAPSIYVAIAKSCQAIGENKAAWDYYERVKQAGRDFGPDQLAEEDRKLYLQVVKMLADSAREAGEIDEAIENYRLLLEASAAGLETYRTLADLYEKKGDVWSALHAVEHAWIHAGKGDPDLKARKDRYYYSITPEEVRQRWEKIRKWFDIEYCLKTARGILNQPQLDVDVLDWAAHLAELAHVADPSRLAVQLLKARVKRLRGETEEAIQMLEDIRANRPERFPSSEEEEAWYSAVRLLGDLYMTDQPHKAIECFLEYKNFPKSGADTFYKLGVCFEAIGDWAQALKCYNQVTAYEAHPRYYDAKEAIERLRQGTAS